MFNKFQATINNILENINAAGAGGAFGTPSAENIIPNPTTGKGYSDNVYAAMSTAIPKTPKGKSKGKGRKKKPVLYIARRKLPKNDL